MMKPLNIAIAGLGTVGAGTADILLTQKALLEKRAGRALALVAVSARDKAKHRGVDLTGVDFVEDATTLASRDEVDVVVELIGGSEGVAKTLVETALKNSKSVVTANKALIAHHGIALATLAEARGAVLAFEAAVAGGIPIIKALRDGLAANQFTRIAGILNGTCNYILTQMLRQNVSFEAALKDAQALGYAEADPTFDVDGIDTAHKLAILASLAFGTAPAIDKVVASGIRRITQKDMVFAEKLGYRIKLLGMAAMSNDGITQRVSPCLVPVNSPLANVHDVYNAIAVEGDRVGKVFFEGRGAGAGPTASSVVADIMDIARGVAYKPFTLPVSALGHAKHASTDALEAPYYLRLSVIDKPGVLADITHLFKTHRISVRSFFQDARNPDAAVDVVLTTHAIQESAMNKALAALSALHSVLETPIVLNIEDV